MPDTKGQSGVEHFEAYAETLEEKSSSSRFATKSVTPGTGGDGHITQEYRGEPDKSTPPGDQPPEPPKAAKKSKRK